MGMFMVGPFCSRGWRKTSPEENNRFGFRRFDRASESRPIEPANKASKTSELDEFSELVQWKVRNWRYGFRPLVDRL
jgi:hypothetical protein